MSDNKEKDPEKKSFMDVYREVNEKERAEEIRRQSEEDAARADQERKARDEYARKLRQEKLELLKLKQGVISEEDIPKEEVIERHYSIWQRIGNFFYHNKAYIIFGAMFLALAVFLIYDFLSKENPDAAVMFIARDDNMQVCYEDMSQLLERYCPDFNGDGEVHVRVSYAPVAPSENANSFAMQEQQSNQTKLMAEFQSVDTIIIIGDRESFEYCGTAEGVFADISGYFPGDENVTGLGYLISGTNLSGDVGCDFSDELVAAFREPHKGTGINLEKFQQNFDNAVEMWTNYLNGNVINPESGTEGE